MPSSAVRAFTDPDEFTASIRQGTCQLTVSARGDFYTELTRIDFHELWIQRFSESLPRIINVHDWGGRAAFSFRTEGRASLSRAGVEMLPGTIMRHGEGQSYYVNSGGSGYGTMSLPIGELAYVSAAIAGCDLTPPKDAEFITSTSAAMAKLQNLHAAASTLAKDAPTVIAHPEAARGLEQALIEAMVGCLTVGEVQEERAALRQHTMIMRKFYRAIDEARDEPLYIPELCKAIGASERTLRICCQEHIGMSPKRYLLLRRMNFARQALRRSDQAETTVTEIATRYGFWSFGRFAGEYRLLFGELPSTTLAHRPG
jgi:AraC-like DNA-binding protein